MYTDLTNKLNTGIKSRFTGFGSTNEIKNAAAAHETKETWVGSAKSFLMRAFDRLGVYPALDDSLFGLNAYLAGDFRPGEMVQDVRRIAQESVAGADPEAKAYLHYDYFDLLADNGYLRTAVALNVAKRMRARQHERKAA